ncbi:uncharacterized protein DS421_20g693680 [Arachis hypogaea]|nr:uncharacterized protein DS421_20g693680 [Arachis hypogaea]
MSPLYRSLSSHQAEASMAVAVELTSEKESSQVREEGVALPFIATQPPSCLVVARVTTDEGKPCLRCCLPVTVIAIHIDTVVIRGVGAVVVSMGVIVVTIAMN